MHDEMNGYQWYASSLLNLQQLILPRILMTDILSAMLDTENPNTIKNVDAIASEKEKRDTVCIISISNNN